MSISGNKTVPYINNDIDLSKYKDDQYLQEGDLIIADASEDYADIGKAIEVKDMGDEKVLAGLHTILARDEKDITINGFKGYLFLTEDLKINIKRIANGISVLGISKNNLSKLSVNIPNKNEQQKIVDFISAIDKKIELLEEKHDYYQDFKKFLMQQIFAQKLRFADYNDEWISKKLGKIVEFLDNKRIPLNEDQRNNQKNIYPYYGASGIIDYVEDYIFDEELILIGEDGTIDVNLASGKFWVSNHAHVLRAKDEINQYFLSEFLKTINFEIYNTGTIQPKLNKETCKSIPIKLPSSLEEQNKIADILFDVNLKLNYIQKEVNEVQNFRKGLLQQMFI